MIRASFPSSTELMLPGPSGELETRITWQPPNQDEFTPNKLAIVCHPHPLHQGNMNNKVVTTLAKVHEIQGCAVVRFNFRGVGNSEGHYGEITGEIEDLRAIINWVLSIAPNAKIYLSGFSFGSYIAAAITNENRYSVVSLISIAPPVNHAPFFRLNAIRCPWLIVQGDQDNVVPYNQVLDLCASPPSPLQLITMQDAGHFFHGRLIELREIIISYFKNNF